MEGEISAQRGFLAAMGRYHTCTDLSSEGSASCQRNELANVKVTEFELTTFTDISAAKPQRSTQKNTHKPVNATHRQSTSLKRVLMTFAILSVCDIYDFSYDWRMYKILEFGRTFGTKRGFALLYAFSRFQHFWRHQNTNITITTVLAINNFRSSILSFFRHCAFSSSRWSG